MEGPFLTKQRWLLLVNVIGTSSALKTDRCLVEYTAFVGALASSAPIWDNA